MEESFLSDLVSGDDIRFDEGVLNLITAPCGAGKTTLVVEHLAPELSSRSTCLYLIDTLAGCEHISNNVFCQFYDPAWRYNLDNLFWYSSEKLNVMTYANFGTLCCYAPGWYEDLDIIFCDEIHNLIQMLQWERNQTSAQTPCHQIAWNTLYSAATENKVGAVVGLTATPQKLYQYIERTYGHDCSTIYDVPIHGTPKQYKNFNTTEYRNLYLLCTQLPAEQKGIIYVQRVTEMNKYVELMRSRGIRAIGLWSIHSPKWELSSEHLRIRAELLTTAEIPDDIDVLFINKSYETSINIKSHLDYIVVHSSEEDVQIQARGRYRDHLDRLYLFNPDKQDELVLPDHMLNTPLYKEQIDAFIKEYNIRNSDGGLMGHCAFLEFIKQCNYRYKRAKQRGSKRYVVITPV